MAVSLSDLISHLDAKQEGNGWISLCPAHDDHNPSLRIDKGDKDGKILLHCRSRNCKFDAIMAAVKRKMNNGASPAPENGNRPGWLPPPEKLAQYEKALGQAEEFLRGRGISMETARKFRLGFDATKGTGMGEIIIPYFIDGALVAIKRRDLNPEAAPTDKWKKHNRDKGVYHLFNHAAALDANWGDDLYITEAELDAIMLEGMGYRAVSIDSASHKFTAADADLLRECPATLCAAHDTDGPGEQGLQRNAEELKPKDFLRILPPTKDLGDLYQQNPAGFPAKLEALRAAAETYKGVQTSATPVVETPLPLKPQTVPADVPFPKDLDERALIGPVAEFVDLLLPYVQCDANCLAMAFLGTVGSIIGRNVWARFAYDLHYPALFINTIGTTTSGKGTGHKCAYTLGELIDPKWFLRGYRTSTASGENLVKLAYEASAPQIPDGDDGMKTNPMYNEGRVLIASSEMALIFNNASRQGANLSAYLRDAYDGTKIENNRSQTSVQAAKYALAHLGNITPREQALVMPNVDFANGVANRYLWNAVKQSKKIPRSTKVPSMAALADKIRALLPTSPVETTFSEAAARVWDEWYLAQPDEDTLIGEACARASANALRLAVLYATIVRSPDAPIVIEPLHVRAATSIVDRSRATLEWYLAQKGVAPNSEKDFDRVTRLRRAVNDGGGRITTNELRDLFSNLAADERKDLAARAGLKIRQQSKTSGGGGRPAEIWTW